MSEIIGREKEISILQKSLNDKKSNLIAIYGRRRVGKTYLIRQFFKDHILFEITGKYQGGYKDQLDGFNHELQLKLKDAAESSISQNWTDAFYQLEAYLDSLGTSYKKVLFFDEFPWLATAKSKFLMAFEYFWNHYCTKRNDLIVVMCGSAASYMTQKIIQNKGGLHNRIDSAICLQPFNLYETDLFLKSKNIDFSYKDTADIYMALGGIPHYLNKIERGLSVMQNIDRLCFEKNAPLAIEFDNLFESLFNHSELHVSIIHTLASTLHGLTRNQIIQKSGIQTSGQLTNAMTELIESGFVSEYRHYGNKTRSKHYRLSDEYAKFYLQFIKPNKNLGKGTWLNLHDTPSFRSWAGFAFEILCLKHIDQIKKALEINGIYSVNSGWFNKEAQIDLLIDRRDRVINICEIKFYFSEFTISEKYYKELRNKIEAFRTATSTRKNLYLTMLTTFGLKTNAYSMELVQNSIELKDLFKN